MVPWQLAEKHLAVIVPSGLSLPCLCGGESGSLLCYTTDCSTTAAVKCVVSLEAHTPPDILTCYICRMQITSKCHSFFCFVFSTSADDFILNSGYSGKYICCIWSVIRTAVCLQREKKNNLSRQFLSLTLTSVLFFICVVILYLTMNHLSGVIFPAGFKD